LATLEASASPYGAASSRLCTTPRPGLVVRPDDAARFERPVEGSARQARHDAASARPQIEQDEPTARSVEETGAVEREAAADADCDTPGTEKDAAVPRGANLKPRPRLAGQAVHDREEAAVERDLVHHSERREGADDTAPGKPSKLHQRLLAEAASMAEAHEGDDAPGDREAGRRRRARECVAAAARMTTRTPPPVATVAQPSPVSLQRSGSLRSQSVRP
jgi:hypothetical protein